MERGSALRERMRFTKREINRRSLSPRTWAMRHWWHLGSTRGVPLEREHLEVADTGWGLRNGDAIELRAPGPMGTRTGPAGVQRNGEARRVASLRVHGGSSSLAPSLSIQADSRRAVSGTNCACASGGPAQNCAPRRRSAAERAMRAEGARRGQTPRSNTAIEADRPNEGSDPVG